MADENQDIFPQNLSGQSAVSEDIDSSNQAPMIINQKPEPTVIKDAPKPSHSFVHNKSFENDAIFHIEVDKIKPNPYQPRKNFDEESLKELAASIREFGDKD